jgi:4-amino-4-deoxy-L-arabinose transferase-like glycosyltransferase
LKYTAIVLFLAFLAVTHTSRVFNELNMGFRETQTAMITRNLVEKEFNPLMPQIDFNGPDKRYMALEFPLYNMLVAGMYSAIGHLNASGKLLTLLFFVGSCYFLYRLITIIKDRKTAIWSVVVYSLIPGVQFYSQSFRPDMTMYFFVFGFFYYGILMTQDARTKYYLAAIFFALLSVTMKMTPFLLICAFVGWVLFDRRLWPPSAHRLMFSFFLVVSCAIVLGAWYLHANKVNAENISFFTEEEFANFNFGTLEKRFSIDDYAKLALSSIRFFSPSILVLLFFGLFFEFKNNRRLSFPFVVLIAGILSYLIFWSTSIANLHYLLIFAFPISYYSARAVCRAMEFIGNQAGPKKKLLMSSAVAFCFFTFSLNAYINIYVNDGSTRSKNYQIPLSAALFVKANTEKNDLVLAFLAEKKMHGWNNPTFFFYSERTGIHVLFNCENDCAGESVSIDEFNADWMKYRDQGYKWLVVTFAEDPSFYLSSRDEALSMIKCRYDKRLDGDGFVLLRIAS